jgi:hypothetical protein
MDGTMTYRIWHKTEDWFGTAEVDWHLKETRRASHRLVLKLTATILIRQDSETPDGTYVEDPHVNSLEDLVLDPPLTFTMS